MASGGIRLRSWGPGVLAASLGVLGSLLFVYRPRLRLGAVIAANGVGFGMGMLAASALDYGSVHPIPALAGQAAFAVVDLSRVLVVAWVLFILWFPDDRFAGPGWRRYFVVSSVLCVMVAVSAWLVGPADQVFGFYQGTRVPQAVAGPFAGAWTAIDGLSNLLLLLPLVAVWSLLQRYRAGDAVVRQQLRWLLVAVTVDVLAQITAGIMTGGSGASENIGVAISVVTQPLPVLAATVAILRHRLWEIDLVVSKALVYGVLWAVLSALLLVPALAAGLVVGGQDAFAAVGIALLVTVVFQPARRRLERTAERLVYRHRARPYVILSGFWSTIRTATLDVIGPTIAEAVHAGLGVRWVGVWIVSEADGGQVLGPLGTVGIDPGPPLCLESELAKALIGSPGLVMTAELPELWPRDAAVVVPLVAADELVGALVCGPRPGDSLGAADFELLELIARECGLRLRNLRLEGRLRQRLAQIEAQARELRRSRQRLVTAEDAARRRIERDLHDGVQQQLVSLSVRLRRAASDGDSSLADLAAEAEQAVFSLQELGRGIYPSVLADQGLTAALRTQAARMPIPVRIEVDRFLAGQRLGRDVETALYYVALEALTNVAKHAPDASAGVSLHTHDGQVRLDVVDDGPGFDVRATEGSGLQNMADRMAAVGGEVMVHHLSGQGTRVSSTVPWDPPEDPHRAQAQPVEADSRR